MTHLAITMGDPAGIGPEITVKALGQLAQWQREQKVYLTLIADPSLFSNAAFDPSLVAIAPVSCPEQVTAGTPNVANGQAVIQSIDRAVAGCLAGDFDAVVTNPISKAVLYDSGFRFPGHTEYLGHLCTVTEPTVMMLASEPLSVVPVTLHTSLFDAISDIRRDGRALITHAVNVTADTLRRAGIESPRIAVSGLNPHAGEGGAMGHEEIDIIAPAIQSFADRHDVIVTGPWPADTLFDTHNREKYDVALGMTHDQALIPIKTLAFDSAVNVTLGLPIVRTSPDHGTAFDIAGKDIARPDSLIAAIKKAANLAQKGAQ